VEATFQNLITLSNQLKCLSINSITLNFNKVKLRCSRNEAYIIEEIFLAHEAKSISISDASGKSPIYEPKVGDTPLWDTIKISALFEQDISINRVSSFLEGITYSDLKITKLLNQNWIQKYQKNFNPIRFGEKLWVIPSWSQDDVDIKGIKLKMDPGLAFGSGTHETTRLCLEYLDEHPPTYDSVLDFGCGSGILAIAALKLGAKYAYCLDIDPQAIYSTLENARKNQILSKIMVLDSPKKIHKNSIDLILANILLNPLLQFSNDFYSYLRPGGTLIISGIKELHLEKAKTEFGKKFTVRQINILNNWAMIELKKD